MGFDSQQALNVVLLEDNALDAELLGVALKSIGFPCWLRRITSFEVFKTALEITPPQLILSDANLPGMESFAALELTRNLLPDIPFVFFTGNESPELREAAMSKGAKDFVSKGDMARLMQITREAWNQMLREIPALLPPAGQWVIVRCRDFRCMGFVDKEGTWRDANQSKELPEVIGWLEE